MEPKLLKIIYIGLAFLFLGIGFVGVVIPVLPTTPFLLLASFFFAKGSERFNKWFMSTKIYKNHLEEFIATRSMTLKKKLCILLPVSAILITTMILIPNLHARIGISLIIILKYYYFFKHIETIGKEDTNNSNKSIISE